jgi:hypothetical protein
VVSTTNTANIGIRHSSTGNLFIVGNISASSGGASHCIYIDSSGSLFVSGSILGVSLGYGIYNLSSGNVNVIGTISGPTGNNGAVSVYNLSNGSVTVTGSVSGGIANYNGKWGIYNAGNGSVYISGSVFGGQGGQQANGVANASNGFVEIIGTVVGSIPGGSGPLAGMAGAQNNGNGTMIIKGPISASIISPGAIATGTGATNLFTGPFYNTGSFNAVYAYRMQMIEPTSTTWTFDTETAGVSKTLYTSNQLPGVPQQTDVRQGTQYNFGLTGSLAMPDPTTVQLGVETDNTTGSAIFTAEDMFNVATQNLTTSGSIGTLLTGASTVQTVGATISSFKV